MSWNTRNKKETVREGAKRRSFRVGLALAWLKEHRPDVYVAIVEQARKKVPLKPGSGLGAGPSIEIAKMAKLLPK